ncbi:MAG: OmpH family outer membrane protein [Marinifilaceae bacterium]|jgi:outer membrane protein|nr:OmpH family outer membrane protein [Marinifilaceae bacterium]
MKNLSLVLNVVLIVAVGVLYAIEFSANNNNNEQAGGSKEGDIVYINTDSLLLNYNFAKDINEKFLKKQEDSRAELNFKLKKLNQEAVDFQKKIQNNGFLTRQRAEQAQQKLIRKEKDLQNLEEKIKNELFNEQNAINKRLFDSVTNYLEAYNSKKNYNLILSTTKGGNVLFSKNGLDITKEIIDGLNARYTKKETAEK